MHRLSWIERHERDESSLVLFTHVCFVFIYSHGQLYKKRERMQWKARMSGVKRPQAEIPAKLCWQMATSIFFSTTLDLDLMVLNGKWNYSYVPPYILCRERSLWLPPSSGSLYLVLLGSGHLEV